MALTSKQRAYLRGLAHHVEPTVLTGAAGVSEAVVAKVSAELEIHELVKVKIAEGSAREAATGLAEATGSDLVQVIGHRVVLYRRRRKDPEIVLPPAAG